MSAPTSPATVDACLRMGGGFSQGDRNWIVEQFATLDAPLARYDADGTDLELSVKDRAARGQKVTLECWVPGHKIVATSTEEDLHDALNDVRDDLRRQLKEAKARRDPRHNARLREGGLRDATALDPAALDPAMLDEESPEPASSAHRDA